MLLLTVNLDQKHVQNDGKTILQELTAVVYRYTLTLGPALREHSLSTPKVASKVAFTLETSLQIKIYPFKFYTDRLRLNYRGYTFICLGFPFTLETSKERILGQEGLRVSRAMGARLSLRAHLCISMLLHRSRFLVFKLFQKSNAGNLGVWGLALRKMS